MRTDLSSVQPADPMGTGSAVPPTATSQTFLHQSVRGVHLSWGSRTGLPGCVGDSPTNTRHSGTSTARTMGTRAAGRVFPAATKSGENDRMCKEGRFEKSEYLGDMKVLNGGVGSCLFPSLIFQNKRWLSVAERSGVFENGQRFFFFS